MDRGAWQATVLEVAKSQTWLSKWAHNFLIYLFLFSCQFLAFRAKPTRGTSESCAMISIMLVSVVISRIYLSSSHRTTWDKTHHISWLTKTTHYSHLPAHYLLHFSWQKLYDFNSLRLESQWDQLCLCKHSGVKQLLYWILKGEICYSVKFCSKLVVTFDKIRCRLFQEYTPFQLGMIICNDTTELVNLRKMSCLINWIWFFQTSCL